MRKIIKIGFPILCVAVIGGTFILLNKTTERINRNRLDNDAEEIIDSSNIDESTLTSDDTLENSLVNEEETKVVEVKNKSKAIELVKQSTPITSDCYYTNEGKDEENYLVAVRDNTTKEAKIYYLVDVQNEKVEIYSK